MQTKRSLNKILYLWNVPQLILCKLPLDNLPHSAEYPLHTLTGTAILASTTSRSAVQVSRHFTPTYSFCNYPPFMPLNGL